MNNLEFPFECACGENYRMIHNAVHCRKCRNYTWAGRCTHVTDLTTGQIVWGRVPTAEEDAEAKARWELESAAERAWLAAEEAEWEKSRLAAIARQALAADEYAEDILWGIQDTLMAS